MAEELYTDLYSSSNNSDGNDGGRGTDELNIPPATKEVRKALAMQRGKAVKRKQGIGKNEIYGLRDKEGNVYNNMDRNCKDKVTADLLKHGWEIVLEELAASYAQ